MRREARIKIILLACDVFYINFKGTAFPFLLESIESSEHTELRTRVW